MLFALRVLDRQAGPPPARMTSTGNTEREVFVLGEIRLSEYITHLQKVLTVVGDLPVAVGHPPRPPSQTVKEYARAFRPDRRVYGDQKKPKVVVVRLDMTPDPHAD